MSGSPASPAAPPRLWLVRALSAAALAAGVLAMSPAARAAGDPRQGEQWGLSTIGAPAAWAAGTGSGITIAVVDTGVDFRHPDLGGKLLPGSNFVTPGAAAQDDNGHGTHVAGIAGAATGNGVGVAGTAPGARILPVKVLDGSGGGSADDVADGIRWAADNGADVINLSLENTVPLLGGLFESPVPGAVRYAWGKGVVVVFAAGNSALFPSSAGAVPALVVTATTRQDQKAGYASGVGSAAWGLAAPGGAGSGGGEDILSTLPGGAYGFKAGTSMAAPHVAAAAAVLRGRGLSPQATVEKLLATAKDLGTPGPDTTFGAGRLDLACAVDRCGAPAPPPDGSAPATSTPPGAAPA
ncbi:MAG: S8 family serine peptidase, partial [Acidimicrobiales bacterium]